MRAVTSEPQRPALPAGVDVVTLGQYPDLWADASRRSARRCLPTSTSTRPQRSAPGLARARHRLAPQTPYSALGGADGLREVHTWTQAGNASMLRLNERLGYVRGRTSITVSRALPLEI